MFAAFDDWIDPIETSIRERVRTFIEEIIREELDAAVQPWSEPAFKR